LFASGDELRLINNNYRSNGIQSINQSVNQFSFIHEHK